MIDHDVTVDCPGCGHIIIGTLGPDTWDEDNTTCRNCGALVTIGMDVRVWRRVEAS